MKSSSLKMETELASRSMNYFWGRVISYNYHGKFLNLMKFLPDNVLHTQQRMNRIRLSAVNFIRKIWLKLFNNGIAYNRVGFKCIWATFSSQYTEFFYKLFNRATESGRSVGSWHFGTILPIKVPKCRRVKVHVFQQKNFKVLRIILSGTWSVPFHYGYCWSHEQPLSGKTQPQRKLYQS